MPSFRFVHHICLHPHLFFSSWSSRLYCRLPPSSSSSSSFSLYRSLSSRCLRGMSSSSLVTTAPASSITNNNNNNKNNKNNNVGSERKFSSNAYNFPFEGIQTKEFISQPQFKNSYEGIPILRQLLYSGKLADEVELPFDLQFGVEIYKMMVKIAVYDQILYDIQRQGRISFYMTNTGEEAAQVGTGAALEKDDVLFPQYRELGVLMWRGFTLDNILDQCFGNAGDAGKGRQMPVHYCNRELNIQAISSPLGTQISQASGAGYALRAAGKKSCAVAYFGEGAASEGDFAVAINFSATLRCQTIFICRNNGFAISTPVKEQYCGDGIAVRAIAYGINCIRVDGNDLVAVFNATREARAMCIREQKPIVIELMTYRLGHHSTSDDSSLYRERDASICFQEEGMNPVGRFKRFLIYQGAWSEDQNDQLIKETRCFILEKLKEAEKRKSKSISQGIFTDVYDNIPWNLKEQRDSFNNFYHKYSKHYDTTKFESEMDFATS